MVFRKTAQRAIEIKMVIILFSFFLRYDYHAKWTRERTWNLYKFSKQSTRTMKISLNTTCREKLHKILRQTIKMEFQAFCNDTQKGFILSSFVEIDLKTTAY